MVTPRGVVMVIVTITLTLAIVDLLFGSWNRGAHE
jgi:hypothetical protein